MNSGPIRAPVDRFARSFHERATVQFLRGVLVVRTAEQADPVRSVEMRSREPVAMIELKSASLRAPAAALVGERAAASVALEDLAFDRVGNMTRTQLVGLLVRCLPCLFEDRPEVSIGHSVPEQVLRLTELVTARATRGELKLERLLGERRNHGPAFIATRRWRAWRCQRKSSRRLGRSHRHGAERECG